MTKNKKKLKRSMLSLDYIFGILIASVASVVIILLIINLSNQGQKIHWIPIHDDQNTYVNYVLTVHTCDELNISLQKNIWKCFIYINKSNRINYNTGLFCGAIIYNKRNNAENCDINNILNNLQQDIIKRYNINLNIFSKASRKDHKFIVLFDGNSFIIY